MFFLLKYNVYFISMNMEPVSNGFLFRSDPTIKISLKLTIFHLWQRTIEIRILNHFSEMCLFCLMNNTTQFHFVLM